MTYTSIDTIPAKLYFKILKTGEIELLTDELECLIASQKEELESIDSDHKIKELEKLHQQAIADFKKELNNHWVNIQKADADLLNDQKNDKAIGLLIKIEGLLAKLESVNLSVFHLKILKDDDLINHLKSYGYKFTDCLKSDLERIERETEAIVLKIKNYQKQLERLKPKDKNNGQVPFDEVVLSYGALTGLPYRTNEITLSEYRALINVGNQKMKALEKSIGSGKR